MGDPEVPSLLYACCEVRNEGFHCGAPKEYFQLEDDCFFTVDFHDMYRLQRRKDLDIAQVTLFAI